MWRALLALTFCLLPWPAAWFGLYLHGSAPLAFLFYHAVCFGGGSLLRSPGLPHTDRISALKRRHLLGAVLGANLCAYLLYMLNGQTALSDLQNDRYPDVKFETFTDLAARSLPHQRAA